MSLNGIRTLSIIWIVIGHAFGVLLFVPLVNITTMTDLPKTNWFQLISGAYFAVDVFFFLSAFLGFYLMTDKLIDSRKGVFAYIFLYVHRYIRILPAMMFMVGLTYFLLPYSGNGPFFFETTAVLKQTCGRYWWSNLLFINNLIPWQEDMGCMI